MQQNNDSVALKYIFPDPSTADKEGLIAAGGDLTVESLLSAYTRGIFPWFGDSSPILWWCPDPRMVLFPEKMKVSRSLLQKIRNPIYQVHIDQNFEDVIHFCADIKRKGQTGTWINRDMKEAYIALHQEGFAHSVETYHGNKLVGGLYGVSLGRVFFGESMFHLISDASKIALYHLTLILRKLDFTLIDVQQSTGHMKRLGAEEIPRHEFLSIVSDAVQSPTIKGRWSSFVELLDENNTMKRTRDMSRRFMNDRLEM